jgi:ABC-type polysaccharide/polyol phosphate transport system ATPase subunit
MGDLKKFYKKKLPEMAKKFVDVTGKKLLEKETVQSTVRALVRKVVTGSREKPFQNVPEVGYCADCILDIINLKDLSPDNICIDGLPGSGKSTLGRILAKKTGLKLKTLHWRDVKSPYPFKKGFIYENQRIIRTQNMAFFDAVIYFNSTIELARKEFSQGTGMVHLSTFWILGS